MEENNNAKENEYQNIPYNIKSWRDKRTIQVNNDVNNNIDLNSKPKEVKGESFLKSFFYFLIIGILVFAMSIIFWIIYLFIIALFIEENADITNTHAFIAFILAIISSIGIMLLIKKKSKENFRGINSK